jgi:hypothetical protein
MQPSLFSKTISHIKAIALIRSTVTIRRYADRPIAFARIDGAPDAPRGLHGRPRASFPQMFPYPAAHEATAPFF